LRVSPWVLGTFVVKGIHRDNRDGFARSEEPRLVTRINALGEEVTKEVDFLTNRGGGTYRSLSLTWTKDITENHRVYAATSFSETIIAPGTETLFSTPEDENIGVFYNGEIVLLRDLERERDNFATPAYATIAYVSTWFEDRLRMNLRGRYRASYSTIQFADLEVRLPVGGGVTETFPVYEDIELDTQFVIDSSFSYTWEFADDHELILEVRIDNLFDLLPNVQTTTVQPYQEGRSFWFGLTYRH
jgi:hypothetical protein